jgi:peptidoglycan/LPS O-acetylase OafA/YrhL
MIRFIFRLLALIILAAAFILLIYDGAKSIADSNIHINTLGQIWTEIHGGSLQALRAMTERRVSARLWTLIARPVLDQPAWLVLGVIGIILMLLGRKKKPLIGYARN